MQQLARSIGFLSLIAGALLVVFPETSRRIIEMRAEFARLSPGALRLLGTWYFLTGTLLISVTTKPAVEAKTRELVSPEIRKAA